MKNFVRSYAVASSATTMAKIVANGLDLNVLGKNYLKRYTRVDPPSGVDRQRCRCPYSGSMRTATA
jgi:hypothetical protein